MEEIVNFLILSLQIRLITKYLTIDSLPEDHILKGNMKDNFWEMVIHFFVHLQEYILIICIF